MVVAGRRLLDVGACARLCWGLNCSFLWVGLLVLLFMVGLSV